MTQRKLEQCNEPGPIQDLNVDPIPQICENNEISQKSVSSSETSWLEDQLNQKTGIGQSGLCDPMQKGHIINEQGMEAPNRDYIYRYSKSIRGTHEAVKDIFSDIVVLDEQGKAWPVPIIWAVQEKAVAMFLQDNVRKDNSLVVDRIKLPAMAIYSTGIQPNQDRFIYHKAIDYLRDYKKDWQPGFFKNEKKFKDTIFGQTRGRPIDISYTLYIWTAFEEDMAQILEQILLKFDPIAYIRVRGIEWEIGVKLESTSNNTNVAPGDQAIPIRKYEINLMAEGFISQPLIRKKSVLKNRIDLVDSVNNDEITQLISRLDILSKELE